MNPLLDILTANPVANNPAGANVSAPTGGAGDGLFALMLTAAVQQVGGQAITSPLTAILSTQPGAAEAPTSEPTVNIEGVPLEGLPASATDGDQPLQAVATLVAPESEAARVATISSSVLQLAPAIETTSVAVPERNIADLVVPQSEIQLAKSVGLLLESFAAVQPPSAQSVTLPATVTITGAESLSNDELAAMLTQSKPLSEKAIDVSVTAAQLQPQLPVSTGPNAQLKTIFQKQFPQLNIQSGSGKVEVDISVKPAAAPTNLAQTAIPAIPAAPVAALPIAPGHRIVRNVVNKQSPEISASVSDRPEPRILDDTETSAEPATDKISARLLNTAPKQFELVTRTHSNESGKPELISTNSTAGNSTSVADQFKTIDAPVLPDEPLARSADLERAHLTVKRVQIETLLQRGEIKLQLQPEHLGLVKIRLVTTPHETTARLETASDDARRAVEANLPQLRESFERAGLKLNQIEVVVGDDSLSRHSHLFQRHPKQPRRPMPVAPVAELASLTSAAANTGSVGLLSGLNLLA